MMTDREIATNYTFFKFRVGSEILGTNIPGQEDHDEHALVIEPPEIMFGCQRFATRFEQDRYKIRNGEHLTGRIENMLTEPGDIDGKAESLHKFVSQMTKGNPNSLQLLFLSESDVLQGAQYLPLFRELRPMVHSRRILKAFANYSRNQYTLLKTHGYDDKSKRPELIEKYGFDTKFAYHAYRLTQQGIEYAETERMTIPLLAPVRHMCMEIRQGHYSREAVSDIIEAKLWKLERLTESSQFPNEPQYAQIDAWIARMYRTMWEVWETSRLATANTTVAFA